MNTCSSGAARASVRRMHGIALPVVLMFLLIITISAVYSIRRSTLSEGITRNQLDYEIARQSAEAALRDAERDLFATYTVKPPAALCDRSSERPLKDKLVAGQWEPDCPRGQCSVTLDDLAKSNYATKANPQPWWPASKGGLWGNNENLANCSFSGGVPIGTFTDTPNVSGVARQPEYLIEKIDRVYDPVMRITARGFGADHNTEVVLQSYVRPPT
jgi:type IV pilus assembly protein PilX